LRQAGWAINDSGLSASGDARGSKSPASSPSAAGFGGFTINTNLYKASFNIWFDRLISEAMTETLSNVAY
jgi:hypothetical protein